MRKIIAIAILALLWTCNTPTGYTSDPAVLDQLLELEESQDYFGLDETFNASKDQLSEAHRGYFTAIIHNVFNRAEASNEAIRLVLEKETPALGDTLLNRLYRTRLQNHVNLYEYGAAAETSTLILSNYRHLNDPAELATLENEIKIWEALAAVPPQEIVKSSDAVIPMVRDMAGLFNVDVAIGDSTKNFIFDTGANFSVIIRSLVEPLGLTLIEADFYVTAATGMRVGSDLAVAPALSIGGITFRNVVFLVFDDKDLSFPQFGYFPNGAIGWPVIEAMEEIRISRDNRLFVPATPSDYQENNFALDGLMPIVAGLHEGKRLRFHFDTGANSTTLYPLFYRENREEIDRNYERQTLSAGGTGGVVDYEGYVIPAFELTIAGSTARLDSLRLHTENIGDEESNFHGNLGQDFIGQFEEMVISFKGATVVFR